METEMVVKIADSVLSPLGLGTGVNYKAVKEGRTSLRKYENKWGLAEPFAASFLDKDMFAALCQEAGVSEGYTYFEQMAIVVAANALKQVEVDVKNKEG